METLELGLVFLSNTDDTYTVELWNAGGLVSKVIAFVLDAGGPIPMFSFATENPSEEVSKPREHGSMLSQHA